MAKSDNSEHRNLEEGKKQFVREKWMKKEINQLFVNIFKSKIDLNFFLISLNTKYFIKIIDLQDRYSYH